MKWRVIASLAAVTLTAVPIAARAQEALFSGKVTSEAGAPIEGAQVYLDKMGIGASTKSDGSYRFVVPAARATGQQATLIAQIIGFKAKSVLVTVTPGQQTFDFQLASAPVVLQQIVITGEGTVTTAEKLGATVNNVKSDEIVQSNENNVTNALAAKAPNVLIQSQSGDPGSSTNIQIRGLKTFSGDGNPLFVIDGVPMDNQTLSTENSFAGVAAQQEGVVAPNRAADINPNDIESVTILKGSAASAIYGARAAQGVVMITTKSGKSGATRYSLRSSYSWDDVTQVYPLERQFGQGDNGANAPVGPDEYAIKYTWGPSLASGTTTYDHMNEMFTTGHVWDNTLSVSGGDDRRTFFLSGGWTNNDGFVVGPNDTYRRATVRLKGSQLIGSSLQISANLNYVDTKGQYVQRGDNVSGIMLGGMRTPPEFNNLDYIDSVSGLHRSYRFPNPTAASLSEGRGYDNPFFTIYDEPSTSQLSRVLGNFTAVWDATDWLKFQDIAGGDYYTDQRLEALPFTNSTQPLGQVIRANYNNYILSNFITAVASHTFSPDFAGTLTVGQEINSQNFSQVYVTGTGLVTPQPLNILNTTSWAPNDSSATIHRESYFAQATFDMWDQLFLTAAVRNDGSSTFGQNDKRHWFPKASAAWTFTKTTGDFGGALDFGKIRFAYGEAGKEPSVYSTLTVFGVGNYFEYGGVGYLKSTYLGQPGLAGPLAVGSDSLRPERTREYEGGLDLGFWHGFGDVGITYYDSRSTDVIFQLPTSPSSGSTSIVANAGVVTNKGWEVGLNLHLIRKQPVTWDLGWQFARNRNNVESLVGVSEIPIGSQAIAATVARVGSPTGSIEGYDFYRCGRNETLNGQNLDQTVCQGKPKGALYLAANGFPVIDTDTLLILGSSQPDFTQSFRTQVTLWQHLQISALVDWRHGGQAYDGTRGALYVYGTHKDTEVRGQTFVFGPSANGVPGFHGDAAVVGPGVGVPVVIGQDWFQGDGGAFGGNTGDFMEDNSFVKLRQIAVQYTFTEPWVGKVGMSSIDVAIAGRNLHTWTNYRGLDPETNLEGANIVQSIDWFNNPQNRSIVFTIGLNR